MYGKKTNLMINCIIMIPMLLLENIFLPIDCLRSADMMDFLSAAAAKVHLLLLRTAAHMMHLWTSVEVVVSWRLLLLSALLSVSVTKKKMSFSCLSVFISVCQYVISDLDKFVMCTLVSRDCVPFC